MALYCKADLQSCSHRRAPVSAEASRDPLRARVGKGSLSPEMNVLVGPFLAKKRPAGGIRGISAATGTSARDFHRARS